MEIVWKDITIGKNKLELNIHDGKINGIYKKNKEEILKGLNITSDQKEKLIIDKKEVKKDELPFYKKRIEVVTEHFKKYYQNKVYEVLYYEIRQKRIILKDPKKRIMDSLKIVGLPSSIYLNKSLTNLSTSEKKQLQLAIALLSNPSILILEEPFKMFDRNLEKKMWLLFQKMKDQYHKTIILISDDTEMLYQYTDYVILIEKGKIIAQGISNEVFQSVKQLKENNIPIPESIEFTYLVKDSKKINIGYHKDIRDIIKDIYKHV